MGKKEREKICILHISPYINVFLFQGYWRIEGLHEIPQQSHQEILDGVKDWNYYGQHNLESQVLRNRADWRAP